MPHKSGFYCPEPHIILIEEEEEKNLCWEMERNLPAAENDSPRSSVYGALVVVHRGVGHLELRADPGQCDGVRPLVAAAAVSLQFGSTSFSF